MCGTEWSQGKIECSREERRNCAWKWPRARIVCEGEFKPYCIDRHLTWRRAREWSAMLNGNDRTADSDCMRVAMTMESNQLPYRDGDPVRVSDDGRIARNRGERMLDTFERNANQSLRVLEFARHRSAREHVVNSTGVAWRRIVQECDLLLKDLRCRLEFVDGSNERGVRHFPLQQLKASHERKERVVQIVTDHGAKKSRALGLFYITQRVHAREKFLRSLVGDLRFVGHRVSRFWVEKAGLGFVWGSVVDRVLKPRSGQRSRMQSDDGTRGCSGRCSNHGSTTLGEMAGSRLSEVR